MVGVGHFQARQRLALAVVAALASFGCGDGFAPRVPARVVVSPDLVVVDRVGAVQQFEARVEDEDGAPIPDAAVVWSSSTPSVASIDSVTGVANSRGAGIATITASAGSARGRARFEVHLPSTQDFVPGATYYGRERYVEYIAGDLPIVLSAPHGGYERPEEIPDRTWGVTNQDRRTQELARAIAAAIHERTGHHPHVIINRLHRIKLDPNREIVEAAQGNSYAQQAWYEFQGFIETAKRAVAAEYGRGFYIDLHGHSHEMQRLELGYLLSSSDLGLSDDQLADPDYVNKSSIRTLAGGTDAGFAELVRGRTSLGGLLARRGYPSVPSPAYPNPGGRPYYSGGYNTRRHGSRAGGAVSGVQLEANWTGVREGESDRQAFAEALAEVLEIYFDAHFGIDLPGGAPPLAGARPFLGTDVLDHSDVRVARLEEIRG